MVDFPDQTAEAVVGVAVRVRRVGDAQGCVSQAGPNDADEDCRYGEAEERQDKDFPGGCSGRVVAVIV